jgi:hypothetical protein
MELARQFTDADPGEIKFQKTPTHGYRGNGFPRTHTSKRIFYFPSPEKKSMEREFSDFLFLQNIFLSQSINFEIFFS